MIICVASSFPERANRNRGIVVDLAEGFREALPAAQVHAFPRLGLETHVACLRPALVVLVGSALPSSADYRELATACRAAGAVFAYWTVEDPYEFDQNYKFTHWADAVFSNDALACRMYDRSDVHHLPTAASPRRRRALTGYADRPLDVFFCGVAYPNRQRLISDLLPSLQAHRSLVMGDGWITPPGDVVVNRRIPAALLDDYYASARFVLNIGRDFSFANQRRQLQAVTPGPRTFEAAVVGCVQFYHQPPSLLSDYFDPEEEIVGFASVEEFDARLKALLDDPARAQAIMAAAQRRALEHHTYAMRARTILSKTGLG